MRLGARPEDVATLQACAAVGQSQLMHFYEALFRQFGLDVAQYSSRRGHAAARCREP